jgi:hypothetical protein
VDLQALSSKRSPDRCRDDDWSCLCRGWDIWPVLRSGWEEEHQGPKTATGLRTCPPSQASAWRLTQRRIRRGVRLHFGSPDQSQLSEALGAKDTEHSMRLYMVPGMQHCDGGPGATSFGQDQADIPHDAQHDIFTALVDWVEKGNAPSTLIASHLAEASGGGEDSPQTSSKTPEMTRPLRPYPQEIQYSGRATRIRRRHSRVLPDPNDRRVSAGKPGRRGFGNSKPTSRACLSVQILSNFC